MKNTNKFLCLCLSFLTFISVASYGAKRTENFAAPKENSTAPGNSVNEKAITDALKKVGTDIKNDKKNAKLLKHEIKAKMKESKTKESRSGVMTIILVLLAIFIPPLAVLLVDGLKGPFWLDLLLTLLFILPGIIYALWRVLKD
jgi:uncharacterized membrane protein YqaE (UPF0057 family)